MLPIDFGLLLICSSYTIILNFAPPCTARCFMGVECTWTVLSKPTQSLNFKQGVLCQLTRNDRLPAIIVYFMCYQNHELTKVYTIVKIWLFYLLAIQHICRLNKTQQVTYTSFTFDGLILSTDNKGLFSLQQIYFHLIFVLFLAWFLLIIIIVIIPAVGRPLLNRSVPH